MLVLVLLLLVALVAGVLALAILFTGFVDTAVCDCPAGEGRGMCPKVACLTCRTGCDVS